MGVIKFQVVNITLKLQFSKTKFKLIEKLNLVLTILTTFSIIIDKYFQEYYDIINNLQQIL